jgi:hypothetical protein
LVNVELGLVKDEYKEAIYLFSDAFEWVLQSVCLPRDGDRERQLLGLVGIIANKTSLSRFIRNNDGGHFKSWSALATAMGVKDTSREVWANEIGHK